MSKFNEGDVAVVSGREYEHFLHFYDLGQKVKIVDKFEHQGLQFYKCEALVGEEQYGLKQMVEESCLTPIEGGSKTVKLQSLHELLSDLRNLVEDNTKNYKYAEKVEEMKAEGLHVYHVIDGTYMLGGVGAVDEVSMTSYCYISEADDLDNIEGFVDDFNEGYCMANVVNTSWGIEELGSIAFEVKDRMMVRKG